MMNITQISSFMDDYKISTNKNIHRFGILPIERTISMLKEIDSLPLTSKTKPEIEAFGKLIDGVTNLKIRTFVNHGTICKCCGIHASFFAVEINKNDVLQSIILNLYAIDENGKEVLMNMDHKLPRFHGGADSLENMQTMCQPCNVKKGCKLILSDGGISKDSIKKKMKQEQREKTLKRINNLL